MTDPYVQNAILVNQQVKLLAENARLRDAMTEALAELDSPLPSSSRMGREFWLANMIEGAAATLQNALRTEAETP